MTPEFIAIITTAAFQTILLGVALWMLYQQSKLLERLSGGIWSVFLAGRNERADLKARLAEVDRLVREELLKK
jgi:cbb3-type cytochrome oxidase subunit 3